MNEEQENKWREEFRIFFFKGSEFWHNSNTAISIEKYSEPYKHGVQGYIEARKKSQEEIDELKEELKREREAVDFYANKRNWQTPESQGFKVDDSCAGITDMIEEFDSRDSNCGGNKARQTQQQRKVEL